MSAEQKAILQNAAQEITKSYSVLMSAFQCNDWRKIGQLYSPGCTIVAPGKPPSKGPPAAEEYWRTVKEQNGIVKMEMKCEEINGSGEYFFDRGFFRFFKGDKPVEECRYLKIWRFWDGKCSIHAVVFNTLPL